MSEHAGTISGKLGGIALSSAVLAALAAPAGAVELTLGIGPAIQPDYLGSNDYVVTGYVTATARDLYHPDTNVRLRGARIESNLVPHPHWRLGPQLEYNFGRPGLHDVDDRRVDAMRDVDGALMVGLIGGYDFDPNPFSSLLLAVDVMQALDDDMGAVARAQLTLARPVNERFSYSVGVDTRYGDDDWMGTFFGVSQGDAQRAGLDRFNADEGFYSVGLNLGGSYRFSDTWSLGLGLRYERLLGDAEDSPVVDDRGSANQLLGFTTVNYHF